MSQLSHDCMDAGGRATHGAVAEPSHLEALRLSIITQIAEILENQTRTQRSATDISQLNHLMLRSQ